MRPRFLLLLAIIMGTADTGHGQSPSVVGRDDRINLVDFARVVQFTGDSPRTLEIEELERGPNGWPAWLGDDDQYMIGVEWDEPRDVAVVNIEFRHAIANRSDVKVQFFRRHWPHAGTGGWARLDDPFHGEWVTIDADWWAGDRDITFEFVPYNVQHADEDHPPNMSHRRTYRLRFLLGDREPPPVRHLRAYGPSPFAEEEFVIVADEAGRLSPPWNASVVNGFFLDQEGSNGIRSARISAAPSVVRVRFAEADLESPSRTIVTLRCEEDPLEGLSFLPAEVVAHGTVHVPSHGITVHHRGTSLEPTASSAPGMSVFDRVAREPQQTWARARRDIPRLRKTEQEPRPFYLPLAPPHARQEIAISYDGAIIMERSALKVRAEDSERVNWPRDAIRFPLSTGEPPFDHAAEGNITQLRLDGYLPIVINTWTHEGIAWEQWCVATYLDAEPAEPRGDETVVMLSRLIMKNVSDQPRKAVARIHVTPREILAKQGDHYLATGHLEDDAPVRYDGARYRFFFRAEGKTALEAHPGDPAVNRLVYTRELAPGESVAADWRVPFVTLDREEELQRIAALDFDDVLARETDRWRRIIREAAVFEVPDALLNDFYKAQLSHILISSNRDPYNGTDVLPAATYLYNVCLNESCHQIRSLDIRGLHEQARLYLDAILRGQSSRPLRGRFEDQRGVFHGLPSKHGDYQTFNYNLDHGFALWMLNEHYRFTRDRAWLESVAESLVAACDFVTRARNTSPGRHTLFADDQRWGLGLLPPGHLEDPPEWLWWFAVNAYAYRGIEATAASLAEIDHPEAGRIARDAAEFGRILRASTRESMVRAPVVRLRDGTWVPHQPTRSRLRGRDLGWIRDALYGPIHLIDCGVYDDHAPEAEWILRDAEDNVFIGEARGRKLEDEQTQWFSWGGITLQSNLVPNPLIYLRRGQPEHAIRAFYNSLAANVYEDVRTFCEHPIARYGKGAGPFFKPPDESAFIVWFRHLLIAEDGDDLLLLGGVPLEWVAPGEEMRVKGAATWFGPMDLHVRGENGRIEVDWTGPDRNPPAEIRLRSPGEGPIRSVTLDGADHGVFDPEAGVIRLPGDIGRGRLIVTH